MIVRTRAQALRAFIAGATAFLTASATSAQPFVDVTTQAGFFGENSSWGSAWGDYDGDGDLDVMTIGHLPGGTDSISQLWRNEADGTFTDVTVAAGMAHWSGDTHGVGWMDLENDGDLDLFVVNGTLKIRGDNYNLLWRNDGGGHFTDIADQAGVVGLFRRGRGVSAADYDRDGLIDVLVPSYNWTRTADDLGNALYHNDGDLRFTSEAVPAGLDRPLQGNRSAKWADFDDDGNLDVFILFRCGLYANYGEFPWVDVTADAGIDASEHCLGSGWADYDHDGDQDLYVSQGGDGSDTPFPDWLYRNDGNGTFTNVAGAAGIVNDQSNRGVAWGDYDNDGFEDLYVVAFRNARDRNRLYHNEGDGTFTDVTDDTTAAQVNGAGMDATFVDYDGDGFLDLFVTNGEGIKVGPYLLLENTGNENHWLKLKLRGTESHADAVMSRVRVDRARGPHYYTFSGPNHNMGQDMTSLHIGMGDETFAEALEVTWPNGLVQRVENVATGQTVKLVEGKSVFEGQASAEESVSEMGFYVSFADGQWRVAWTGDEEEHSFSVRLTTEGAISNAVGFGLDGDDTFRFTSSLLKAIGNAGAGATEGFTLDATGGSVTLDLRIDGSRSPAHVFLGAARVLPGQLPLELAEPETPERATPVATRAAASGAAL